MKMKKELGTLARILYIMQRCDIDGVSCSNPPVGYMSQLARELNVHRATIMRDFRRIEKARKELSSLR